MHMKVNKAVLREILNTEPPRERRGSLDKGWKLLKACKNAIT